jgi:hypothetical protein
MMFPDMALPSDEKPSLQIRCPSCSQTFKVGVDLRGKTVECGACNHRFVIEEEVILRGVKIYPGERRANLERFSKSPKVAAPPANFQPANYTLSPEMGAAQPVSTQDLIQGSIGFIAMVLTALFFIFGFGKGSTFDGLSQPVRVVFAALMALVGGALMVRAANARRRKAVLLMALFFGLGLVALPFLMRPPVVKTNAPATAPGVVALEKKESNEKKLTPEQLIERIGTAPLEAENDRLKAAGEKPAVGLWLREMAESNRLSTRDFILRTTRANPSSHQYPRDRGEYLMVLSGVDATLEEIAEMLKELGTSTIHEEIGVIEILIDNSIFIEGPIAKLTDKNDPAFYDLNRRELESVQLDRVARAVKRLADAEPKVYRIDITNRLIELLREDKVDFYGDVCWALSVWSETPGPAGDAAADRLRRLRTQKSFVPPREMVALLAKEKNTSVIPMIGELWIDDATSWEPLFADFGPAIESEVLKRFPETTGSIRHSATRLLGKTGSSVSLPVLEAAKEGADAELAVLIENAQNAIRARSRD